MRFVLLARCQGGVRSAWDIERYALQILGVSDSAGAGKEWVDCTPEDAINAVLEAGASLAIDLDLLDTDRSRLPAATPRPFSVLLKSIAPALVHLTPGQCRVASAYLGMGRDDLAKETGVSRNTISRFEEGGGELRAENYRKLVAFFMRCGIEFLDERTVRFPEGSGAGPRLRRRTGRAR